MFVCFFVDRRRGCTARTTRPRGTTTDGTGQCGSFRCSGARTVRRWLRRWTSARRSTRTPTSVSSDSTTTVKSSASVSSPTSHPTAAKSKPILYVNWVINLRSHLSSLFFFFLNHYWVLKPFVIWTPLFCFCYFSCLHSCHLAISMW